MPYVIGTDEAGYGPNLGPLVISASAWHVPDGVEPGDLYARLAEVVTPVLPRRGGRDDRIAIADSKTLYQGGKGPTNLERALWPALAQLDCRPRRWSEVWAALSPDGRAPCDSAPWHVGYDRPVPLAADPSELDRAADRLREGLAGAGVRLVALKSRAVFPAEFNAAVQRDGSKGTTLSRCTIALAAEIAAQLDDGPVRVVCDKHGGRNRYAPLLAECFPGEFVEIHGESARQSLYRFGPARQRVEMRFCVGAESYLPTALASIASKYLRELAMGALNEFWCRRVDGLHPTAGYPVDARRFKAAIASVQSALGIDDCVLWRQR